MRKSHFVVVLSVVAAVLLANALPIHAQDEPESILPAPARAEGEGPFPRLILRGGTLIDGTGAPPIGPVDIVIEDNRIASIRLVGSPGLPIDPERRPKAGEGDREIDVEGKYVLPGFIDMHAHIGGVAQGTPAEYVFKLWMGHGITTVREAGSGNGLDWVLEHKEKSGSERDHRTADRGLPLLRLGSATSRSPTPEEAREWVGEIAEQGGRRGQVLRSSTGHHGGRHRRGVAAWPQDDCAITPSSRWPGSTSSTPPAGA